MDASHQLHTLREDLRDELIGHILPYWMERAIDDVHGGFVGRITQTGAVVPEAPKGAVLNARILWTFAAAYRLLGDDAYRAIADRAFAYFDHFWDDAHEGVYWSVDYRGAPLEPRKQTYAQAFALYGLAEYHRATGTPAALDRAVRLFECIEAHVHDPQYGGYLEAMSRTWAPIEDMRLSAIDLNAPKSMNTHLHVLEAYTALYRVWPHERLRRQQAGLIKVFLGHILDPAEHHLFSFFDEGWHPLAEIVSFGHDIEASWLLLEAADVLDDAALRARVRAQSVAVARVTRRVGQDRDGGLFYEAEPDGTLDTDKHWWPQAEAIVGFLNAYQETGEADFLAAAVEAWAFTKQHVIDRRSGEWFGRLTRAGVPYDDEDKVGLWKCPYHNARACLEVMERTAAITTGTA